MTSSIFSHGYTMLDSLSTTVMITYQIIGCYHLTFTFVYHDNYTKKRGYFDFTKNLEAIPRLSQVSISITLGLCKGLVNYVLV